MDANEELETRDQRRGALKHGAEESSGGGGAVLERGAGSGAEAGGVGGGVAGQDRGVAGVRDALVRGDGSGVELVVLVGGTVEGENV